MLKKISIAIFTLVMLSGSITPLSAKVIDKVVAVVGDEIILKSDVDNQALLFAYQNQMPQNDPQIWKQVFNAIINQKVLLTKAKLDSVQISLDQVDQLVEERVEFLKSRFQSEDEIVERFGKSIARIRVDLREEIKGQRLVESLQQSRIAKVTISNEEVVDFYNTYKDSLPVIPSEAEVAHIVIKPKVDSLAKISALNKIQAVKQRLESGEDFEMLAKELSQDPGSAKLGGDLGFVRRGEFVRRFEEVAFALKEGEVSGLVETEFGYHIIKLLERKGEAIRVQHILIQFDKTKLNDQAAIEALSKAREQILNGKVSFETKARQISEDESSREKGGYIVSPKTGLKRIALTEMLPELKTIVEKLEPGQISQPSKINLGNSYVYAIVKLNYLAPEHQINLKQDYAKIRNIALKKKQSDVFQDWVKRLKEDVYIDVRL
jgi:peptidyl-prolyl cis-trans isomerase SurA